MCCFSVAQTHIAGDESPAERRERVRDPARVCVITTVGRSTTTATGDHDTSSSSLSFHDSSSAITFLRCISFHWLLLFSPGGTQIGEAGDGLTRAPRENVR